MSYLLGVLAFVAALLASVVLHEAGHFLAAKRFGMKATQFFVGFGPTLWSRVRGETEYGVKAIPAGGFVKIVGYTPLEEIDPADEPRAFYRQPAGKRAVVIVAGVAMNLLIAFLLLFVMGMTLGERVPGRATSTVEAVSPCVSQTAGGSCDGRPRSPAASAGIRPGDVVTVFGGRPIANWADLRAAIEAQPAGAAVPVTVVRDGTPVTFTVTLARAGGSNFLGVTSRIAGAGWRVRGPVGAAGYAGSVIGTTVRGIGGVVADLPSAIPRLFSPDRASTPGGQVGSVVGATEVSGQIFQADASGRAKTDAYLQLVVSVNIFLAALNVIPLLPLDGGHLAIVAYGVIRGMINRARGRPDPGTVDMARLLPLTYLVVLVLIGLGTLLILADVLNPLTISR